MKRKEWEALKSLSLEDKKKELEKERLLFVEANKKGDIKEEDKHIERMVVIKKMIDFKPDPDFYKKKRALERAEWGEKRRKEIAFIANIKKL